MTTIAARESNFNHLQKYDEQLVRLGALAERYFADDPNTSLIKMRQFGELLAKQTATQTGLYESDKEESQYDLLRRLRDEGVLSAEVHQLFGEVRRAGNAASHSIEGSQPVARSAIKIGWQLGVWFHRAFVSSEFQPGEFVEPSSVSEIDALRAEREELAAQAERANSKVDELLRARQAASERKHAATFGRQRQAAESANGSIRLDEAETRQIIDQQLREAGWEADTIRIRYGEGACPEKGRNRAIAEWPTASGPAD